MKLIQSFFSLQENDCNCLNFMNVILFDQKKFADCELTLRYQINCCMEINSYCDHLNFQVEV